ncbi:MAG: ATP-binding protein [Clostridiales bacterium]|nr:ATP-binding protein [Clostridiales bacterium]
MKLPSKAEYVSIARLAASVISNTVGFDIEDIDDIKVAVGEACNNAVLHGKNEEEVYEIAFKLSDEKIHIEVKDNGIGFDEEKYEEPDLDNLKGNGLGIYIMKSLMDEVDIIANDKDGTTLKLVKYLE